MSQSLSNVLLHLVFSTKNRQRWINPEIEEELFRYLAGTCRKLLQKYDVDFDEEYVWD